jgi:hypothetical protein
VLETIKRYQAKAPGLPPDMAAEYAGTIMALARTHRQESSKSGRELSPC